jgi:hypothetical protein
VAGLVADGRHPARAEIRPVEQSLEAGIDDA